MPAIQVGKKVTYHSEHGPWVGFVVEYVEGRLSGDYLIKGFTNHAATVAGEGDTFARWSVSGDEQGAFSSGH